MMLTTASWTSQFRGCQSPWVGTTVADGVGHAAISARSRSTVSGAILCGSFEPRQCLLVLTLLVVVVRGGGLGVERGQQLACLTVGGRNIGVPAAEHQVARKVQGDEELRRLVAILQSGCAAPAGPRTQPVEMGVDLARDVNVTLAAGLDDES